MRWLPSILSLLLLGLAVLAQPGPPGPSKRTTKTARTQKPRSATVPKPKSVASGKKTTTSTSRRAASSKKTTSAARKSTTSSKKKTTSSKRRRSRSSRGYRAGQQQPTKERLAEIQRALQERGYLTEAQVTGNWDAASIEALKRFQGDENIKADGKISALSLIALGLGPKRSPVNQQKTTQ